MRRSRNGQLGLVMSWVVRHKADPVGARLADGHYSRRKVGAPQFMPPGQTLVLVSGDGLAVFGWWRPDPKSGLQAMNGLDGWTCTIFRNTGQQQSSTMILEAERPVIFGATRDRRYRISFGTPAEYFADSLHDDGSPIDTSKMRGIAWYLWDEETDENGEWFGDIIQYGIAPTRRAAIGHAKTAVGK